MSFENVSVIHVYYLPRSQKIKVGRLAIKNRIIYFEYEPQFLSSGLALSPFKLPLKPGVMTQKDHVFDGLLGVFNDSLPDGWGRLLLDRKLISLGVNPGELSPLDRLRYVGQSGMGALTYEPEIENIPANYQQSLDEIEEEVIQFQETDDDTYVDDLLAMNGSSAGARPKILVNIINESWLTTSEQPKNNDWIIKFRSSHDPRDNGPIEYAYHLMAKAAGLDVPTARLFQSKREPGYYGVKRFDRDGQQRLHTHTLCGLLHTDYRIPSLDYETILKATWLLSNDIRECEKQYRAAVFNVLAHNRDDHSKNFSFIMSEHGTWHVSPAYDLIFSSGPAGEQSTMVMGEGKMPGTSHLLKLAATVDIAPIKAKTIIDEVFHAISNWQNFAKATGVNKTSSARIQSALNKIAKHC